MLLVVLASFQPPSSKVPRTLLDHEGHSPLLFLSSILTALFQLLPLLLSKCSGLVLSKVPGPLLRVNPIKHP